MKSAIVPVLLAGIAFSVVAASGGAKKSEPRPLGSGLSDESPLAYARGSVFFHRFQAQRRRQFFLSSKPCVSGFPKPDRAPLGGAKEIPLYPRFGSAQQRIGRSLPVGCKLCRPHCGLGCFLFL